MAFGDFLKRICIGREQEEIQLFAFPAEKR